VPPESTTITSKNTQNFCKNLCQDALKIASRGKPVFPCNEHKRPLVKDWGNKATTNPGRVHGLFLRRSAKLIAVPAGRRSGLFVVDFDRMEALDELPEELPDTLTVRTRSGARHYYFRHVEGVNNSPGSLPAGIDVRGEGGYVIVPPSEGYETIHRRPIAEAPEWLLELIRERKRPAAAAANGAGPGPIDLEATDSIPDGSRNNTLVSIGGWLRARGFEQPEIEQALFNVNEKRCNPPLGVDEVRRIAWSVSRYEKGKAGAPPDAATLEAIDAFEKDLWAAAWPKIGGKSERSIAVMAIKLARMFGRLTKDGNIAVNASHRALALVCATSRLSLRRAIERSEWLRQGDKGEGKNAGTIILVVRAKLTHSNHRESLEGGSNACGLPLRAPFSAPRLRWSAPDILRLGKTCEAVVDYLERAGGSYGIDELAEAMHVSRVRDFRKRNLGRLEERGIVTVEGNTVSLVENWLEALEVEREASGEIAKFRRDQQKFDREREAWAERLDNKPDESPSEDDLAVDREAWCNRREASGEIGELERVPEALSLKELYKLMHAETPVETTLGRGRLWQVFTEEVGVVLDEEPKAVKRLHPVDVLGPVVKRAVA
jgi:hypothetical protein